MKVRIATVSCGIEVNCLGVFTNSPKSEVQLSSKTTVNWSLRKTMRFPSVTREISSF